MKPLSNSLLNHMQARREQGQSDNPPLVLLEPSVIPLNNRAGRLSQQPTTAALPVQPIQVLVVDDQQILIWGLQKLLDAGTPRMQAVGSATSVAGTLEALRQHRPDIVLLDVMLEDRRGLNLIAPIRQAGAKVIILTAADPAGFLDQAVLAGASGLIRKYEPTDIIPKAIDCVFRGELWLDRGTTARVVDTLRSSERLNMPHDALTDAERKVIAAVLEHRSAPNKVIASALNISAHTLRNHLASIYEKLGVNRRLDVVLYAMENGLDRTPQIAARQ
jgi:DNA-binding NarL/FixJ family response regulator